MFTQTLNPRLRDRVLRSPLVDLLTGPHGVDRYTELVAPTWTSGDARAKIVAVRRQTPRSVTLTLEPNRAFTGFRAGQHINLTVEIDGRRRLNALKMGFGTGIRTTMLFMIFKLDVAWRTDLVDASQPRWMFSIGPEF